MIGMAAGLMSHLSWLESYLQTTFGACMLAEMYCHDDLFGAML